MAVEVVCPHCGSTGFVELPAKRDVVEAAVLCFACGRDFSRHAVAPRAEHFWGRPRPDPARILRLPANILYVFAALELALLVATLIALTLVLGPDAAKNAAPTNSATFDVLVFGVIIGIGRDVLILVGARRMLRRDIYPLAIAGAVAAIIPVGCWSFGGFAVGIWGLVALCQPGIPARFGNPPPRWDGERRPPHRRRESDDVPVVYPLPRVESQEQRPPEPPEPTK